MTDQGVDPRTRPRWYPLERDVLRIGGTDATTYLQGQVSQDVEAVEVGDSAWTFVLAPAGKVDSWFRLWRGEDHWIADVDAGHGDRLHARLSRFLLRTDATIEPVDWSAIALRGPGAGDLAPPGDELAVDPAWPGIEGLDLLGPGAEVPPGVDAGQVADLDAMRILAGVPSLGAELNETTIPAAAGVVDRSVSFTKGCYTGQELVARINSRGGSTPTRLVGVRTSVPELRAGAVVVVDGEEVGSLTSVADAAWLGQSVGLAYLKRAVEVSEGDVLDAQAGPDHVAIEVRALPTG